MLAALCLCVAASAQCTASRTKAKSSSHSAHIARYFLAPAEQGYETGALHILYADGTKCVERLPPLKKSTQQETVFNSVGFADVKLAEDRRTLGWEVNVENCCTSYSIPSSVIVFRNNRVLHEFKQGQMVWSWMFVDGGDQVAIVFGTVHGPEIGDYRLYDVSTGKLLAQVSGDEDTQALKLDAPEWAKRLEHHLHSRP